MQQIKRVIKKKRFTPTAIILQILKARTPLQVQAYNLAIQNHRCTRQLRDRLNNSRKTLRQIVAIPRENPDRPAILHHDPAIAIKLQLINPPIPARQSLRGIKQHRFNESWEGQDSE